ncbi:MAG: hypothetical protein JRI68_20775 [Deltaproteobacteria bacterium]|nr:hypothetical protein [Deltaproteobacteria bacterium]
MQGKAIRLGAAAALVCAAATCMMDFDEFEHTSLPTSSSTGSTTSGTGGGGGTIFTGGGGTSTSGTGGSTSGTGGSTGGAGGTTSSGGGVGGAGVVTVACEQAPCNLANGGHCCLPQSGGTAVCESQGNDCQAGYAEVHCDEPGDCPNGEECCATFDYQDGYTLLECVANCGGPTHFIICDDDNDCDGNDHCEASSYLPSGYEVCK